MHTYDTHVLQGVLPAHEAAVAHAEPGAAEEEQRPESLPGNHGGQLAAGDTGGHGGTGGDVGGHVGTCGGI